MKLPYLHHRVRAGGFTIIELLTVIAIIVVLSTLALPMISSLKKAGQLNLATSSISTLLDQARSYAMANNTYVFICFEETNFSTPSNQLQTPGIGRVAVRVYSSLDGTMNLANVSPVCRLQIFENVDLPASIGGTTGTLSGRPSVAPGYVVGNSTFPTATGTITSGNFTFNKILAFDPLGQVHLPTNPPQTGLQYLEIDVQESNGSTVPSAATNLSALQIDGLTGAVIIYRS